MIQCGHEHSLLGRFRHLPAVDRGSLEELLLRVSEIACEMPEVQELDVNPIIADESGALALDARVVLKSVPPDLRRLRFQSALRGLSPQMLARFTQIDYDREMALVAIDSSGGADRQVAVARYIRLPDGRSCEFAIVVADAWQGRGLGRLMMARLIAVARDRELRTMAGWVLSGNRGMLEMVTRMGFETTPDPDDPQNVTVTLAL